MSAILERLAGLLAFEPSTASTKKQQDAYRTAATQKANAEANTNQKAPKPDAEKRP